MEFFDWLNIPQAFLQFFEQEADKAEVAAAIMRRNLIICLIVAVGLFILGLVLGGIGLYTICKRTGRKHGWLGFLPFANTYLAGQIAGEANFFGQKMKRAGLYAMLCEIAYAALGIFLIVIEFLLTRPEYYVLQPSQFSPETYYWTLDPSAVAGQGLSWVYNASRYGEIVSYLVYFFVLVFFCVMFFAFFRKYYARSPFLMVFLSVILPFRGFTIFAVRKNTPVDYNAYMRRRAEELARRSAPYGPGGYGPGSYGPGGYGEQPGQGQYGGGQAPPEDPFGDFGGGNGGNNNGGGNGGNGGGNAPEPPGEDPFSDF